MSSTPGMPPSADRSGKRTFHRFLPPSPPTEERDEQLRNAWPGGLRTMSCLWCDREFVSSGRHERMCTRCRRLSA